MANLNENSMQEMQRYIHIHIYENRDCYTITVCFVKFITKIGKLLKYEKKYKNNKNAFHSNIYVSC